MKKTISHNHRINPLFINLIGLLISISAQAQNTSQPVNFTERYCLDLKSRDTTTHYTFNQTGYSPLIYLSTGEAGPVYLQASATSPNLDGGIQQQIILPNDTVRQVQLSFSSRNLEGVESGYARLYMHNSRGDIIGADTLIFYPDTSRHVFSSDLHVNKPAELLLFELGGKGAQNKDAGLVFSDIQFKLDGISLDSFPERRLSTPSKDMFAYRAVDPKQWKTIEPLGLFHGESIVTFGESMHYVDAVEDLRWDITLQAVRAGKCKLILLESNLNMGLIIERYINDFNYPVEALKPNRNNNTPIHQLRAYNQSVPENERVHFAGLDCIIYDQRPDSKLTSELVYLYHLNKRFQAPVLDRLILSYMEKNFTRTLHFLHEHKDELRKYLTEFEYDLMLLNEELKITSYEEDAHKRRDTRDYRMARIARFAIDKYNPQGKNPVLMCHVTHAAQHFIYPFQCHIRTLGSYLKEYYGTRYKPQLLLVGQGEYTRNRLHFRKGLVKEAGAMQPVLEGSVEQALLQLPAPTLYSPMPKELDRLYLYRLTGTGGLQREFFPANLYHDFEGLFFVRETRLHQPIPHPAVRLSFKEILSEVKKRLDESSDQ